MFFFETGRYGNNFSQLEFISNKYHVVQKTMALNIVPI